MKIRFGFVSNSSSSSFICSRKTFDSVFHLGKEMLKIRNQEWNEYSDEELLQVETRKLIKAEELNINPNIPIVFSTTNYDTYIRVDESRKYYEVNTCNNQHWEQLPNSHLIQFNDSFEFSTEINRLYFWWIEKGIVGRPIIDDYDKVWIEHIKINNIKNTFRHCTNTEHFDAIVEDINGNVVCIDCYKLSNQKDMILFPAKQIYLQSSYIPKSRLKLR